MATSTNLIPEDRLALLARIRGEAAAVAKEGFWPAPKGVRFLYWAVNPANLKIYIGVTHDFQGRVAEHRNRALNGGTLPFHRALRRYGVDTFVFVPIEEFTNDTEMARAERQAITDYHAQDREIGYNIADGGAGIGSRGAREVHARPEYRALFLASRFERARKAAETRRRNRMLREGQR